MAEETKPPKAVPSEDDFFLYVSKKFRHKYKGKKMVTQGQDPSNNENLANPHGIVIPLETFAPMPPPAWAIRNRNRKNVLQPSTSRNRSTPSLFKKPLTPPETGRPLLANQAMVRGPTVQMDSLRFPIDTLSNWLSIQGTQLISVAKPPEQKPTVIVRAPAAMALPNLGPPPGMFRPWENPMINPVPASKLSPKPKSDINRETTASELDSAAIQEPEPQGMKQGSNADHVPAENYALEQDLDPTQENNPYQESERDSAQNPHQDPVREPTVGFERPLTSSPTSSSDESEGSELDFVPLNQSALRVFESSAHSLPSVESLASMSNTQGSTGALEGPTSTTTIPSPSRLSLTHETNEKIHSPLLTDVSSSTTTSEVCQSAELSQSGPSTSGVTSKHSKLNSNSISDEGSGESWEKSLPLNSKAASPLGPSEPKEVDRETPTSSKRCLSRRVSGGIPRHPHPHVERQMRSSQNAVLHNTKEYFYCQMCSKSYYTQKALDQHFRHKHQPPSTEGDESVALHFL